MTKELDTKPNQVSRVMKEIKQAEVPELFTFVVLFTSTVLNGAREHIDGKDSLVNVAMGYHALVAIGQEEQATQVLVQAVVDRTHGIVRHSTAKMSLAEILLVTQPDSARLIQRDVEDTKVERDSLLGPIVALREMLAPHNQHVVVPVKDKDGNFSSVGKSRYPVRLLEEVVDGALGLGELPDGLNSIMYKHEVLGLALDALTWRGDDLSAGLKEKLYDLVVKQMPPIIKLQTWFRDVWRLNEEDMSQVVGRMNAEQRQQLVEFADYPWNMTDVQVIKQMTLMKEVYLMGDQSRLNQNMMETLLRMVEQSTENPLVGDALLQAWSDRQEELEVLETYTWLIANPNDVVRMKRLQKTLKRKAKKSTGLEDQCGILLAEAMELLLCKLLKEEGSKKKIEDWWLDTIEENEELLPRDQIHMAYKVFWEAVTDTRQNEDESDMKLRSDRWLAGLVSMGDLTDEEAESFIWDFNKLDEIYRLGLVRRLVEVMVKIDNGLPDYISPQYQKAVDRLSQVITGVKQEEKWPLLVEALRQADECGLVDDGEAGDDNLSLGTVDRLVEMVDTNMTSETILNKNFSGLSLWRKIRPWLRRKLLINTKMTRVDDLDHLRQLASEVNTELGDRELEVWYLNLLNNCEIDFSLADFKMVRGLTDWSEIQPDGSKLVGSAWVEEMVDLLAKAKVRMGKNQAKVSDERMGEVLKMQPQVYANLKIVMTSLLSNDGVRKEIEDGLPSRAKKGKPLSQSRYEWLKQQLGVEEAD